MREILFRGKSNWTYGNVKKGDWLYSMTVSPHCYTDEKITSYYIGGGNNTIDAKTLGQYTGLTDKNGKKIFEGDIVQHDFGAEQIGVQYAVVEYDAKYASFMINPLYDWMYCDKNDCEVIGNIHDNPELVKGGAE